MLGSHFLADLPDLVLVEVAEEVLSNLLALAGGVLSTKSSLESVKFFLTAFEAFWLVDTSPAFFLGCGELVVELAVELLDTSALLLFLPPLDRGGLAPELFILEWLTVRVAPVR